MSTYTQRGNNCLAAIIIGAPYNLPRISEQAGRQATVDPDNNSVSDEKTDLLCR
jgi:hypothetical protein